MAEKQKLLRFSMLIKRHPDMSEEKFQEYWTQTHGPIVKEWLAKHGVIKYTQHHTPSHLRQQSKSVWNELGGINVLDFDGHVELLVPSIDCLKNALADPYYKSDVEPDEAKFLDPSKCARTVGWEEIYVLDGKVQRTPNVITG